MLANIAGGPRRARIGHNAKSALPATRVVVGVLGYGLAEAEVRNPADNAAPSIPKLLTVSVLGARLQTNEPWPLGPAGVRAPVGTPFCVARVHCLHCGAELIYDP